MYPRFFDISTGINGLGDLVLPSYFAMVTMGFIVATMIIRRFAAQHGLDKRLITDFIIWMALWGLLGARILHVIADGHFWDYVNICRDPSLVDWKVDLRECRALEGVWDAARGICHPAEAYCLAWIDLRSGGLAFYGGFVAAALFSVYFIRKHNLPAGKLIDLSGWVLMLGLAWGRMGCFLASCCFGARTDSVLGVVFPGGSAASRKHWEEGLLESYRMASFPVHPTQLYEAALGLAIAAFAYFWVHPRKRFDGQVFCVIAGLYAVGRFMIEFLRRDDRGAIAGLSTSQITAIGFLLASAYLWRYFRRRAQAMSE
ncbi:MAG: prolipoprotein diacylglyceryl transferase [Proteobacteria bacterium]|nr:prolipoprotein diacylglyceryl transferase [Pseudomonadota bacterium]